MRKLEELYPLFPGFGSDNKKDALDKVRQEVQRQFDRARPRSQLLHELVFHGTTHSLDLLHMAALLLGDSCYRLSEDEVYALFLAALMHDVGLVKCRDLSERHLHGTFSEQMVEGLLYKLGLNQEIPWTIVSTVQTVVRHHTKEGSGELPPGLHGIEGWLTALVRLADACDLSSDRAPLGEWRKWGHKLLPLSRYHWVLHRTVANVRPRGRAIAVTVKVPDPELLRFLGENIVSDLATELKLIQPALPRKDIQFDGFEEVTLAVLPGGDGSVPELLQAGFWAKARSLYRVRSSSDLADFYASTVHDLCRSPLSDSQVQESIGAMNKVALEQPQAVMLQRAVAVVRAARRAKAWRNQIGEEVARFARARRRSLRQTAALAADGLAKVTPANFLLFSYSSPVIAALKELYERGHEFKAYATTIRGIVEIDHLFILEGQSKVDIPYPITAVTGSLLFSVLASGKIGAVLMGCEAVCPDGSIVSSCGCRMVAQLAASLQPPVPVYVVTDGAKAVTSDPYRVKVAKRRLRQFLQQELPGRVSTRGWYSLDEEFAVSEVVPGGLVEVLCDGLWWAAPTAGGAPGQASQWSGCTLVFDVDGTLRTGSMGVPKNLRDKLAEVLGGGGTVVLASGKDARYLRGFARTELGLDPDRVVYITENGCLSLWNEGSRRVRLAFPAGAAQREWLDDARKELKRRLPGSVRFQQNSIALTIFGDDAALESARAILGGVDGGRGEYAAWLVDGSRIRMYRHVDSIDCLPAGADKGRALSAVINKRFLRPDRVIAIGDSVNDIPMFRVAARAIAVGTRDEVAAQADARAATALEALQVAEAWTKGLPTPRRSIPEIPPASATGPVSQLVAPPGAPPSSAAGAAAGER
jgi:HAD superfamily hydrolase (TIGR01484 family)